MQMLARGFAVKCTKNERFKDLFPLNNPQNNDKYTVKFAHTNRLRDSAIPAMQRLLNKK